MSQGSQGRVVVWVVSGWLCLFNAGAWGQFSGGSGSKTNPYLIATAGDMQTLSANSVYWNGHFKLTADIDLTGVPMTPIGNNTTKFAGTFDGNGYVIANLTINLPGTNYVGLFGYVESVLDPNSIFNLGLINPVIAGYSRVGALVGRLRKCTISGCYVEEGTVNGKWNVGILVGWNSAGAISDCYVTGQILGFGNYVGGLVGYNGGTITACYAAGAVFGRNLAGGLVGYSLGTIRYSYATSAVSGSRDVGGLVGLNDFDMVSHCYATGLVNNGNSKTDVGGLIGRNKNTVINSYWATDSSGQATSAGGIGKTLFELKQASTFLGWGCDLLWTIDEGNDTPHLIWEMAGGNLITYLPSYSGGTGDPDTPYLINTAQDLLELSRTSCHWDKHFILTADLDLTGELMTPIGNWRERFSGIFDGNGHTIANLTINLPTTSFVGLFGVVDNTVDPNAIFNLALINPDITGNQYVGGLAGWLVGGTISGCFTDGGSVNSNLFTSGLVGVNSGTIRDCYAIGMVTGKLWAGGLVGSNYGGTIRYCYTTGSVSGSSYVGGLVGENSGKISNSYATGAVTGSRSSVGGMVGSNYEGTISECYATGAVTGAKSDVGGLVGFNYDGIISNCYTSGTVEGEDSIGGLVGNNYEGTIRKCFAIGAVTGSSSDVGGLVGFDYNGTVSASFWNTQTSGQTSSAGGTGKTTAEMLMAITYAEWLCSYEGRWTFDEGNDFPHLVWENMAGVALVDLLLSGGSGTMQDPYLIPTSHFLVMLGETSCFWDKHFRLTADIDMTGVAMKPIGNAPMSLPFSGTFDGNGFTIANLLINLPTTNSVGLFSYLNNWVDPNTIFNLGLINPDITGRVGVGGLVGLMGSGTLSGCYVEGGVINGLVAVGGLVGISHGMIRNCYTSGNVTGTNSTVGGLVGFVSEWGIISNSYATSAVDGPEYIGGLVGDLVDWGTIRNCYATGQVNGTNYVGGLVGENFAGIISHCYSIGAVTGSSSSVGGLVGLDINGTVIASFWNTDTSGQLTSDGGTGKTTALMQDPNTFISAGWDFVGESVNGTEDIWDICEGTNYPRFEWQIPLGDFVCPEHMQVWFTPQRFNPMSQGKWIKGHVIMPEGIEPADIDPAIMVLLAPFGILSDEVEVMMDESGRVELAIAFDRAEILAALEIEAENHSVGITLIGAFADGSSFYATRTISILKSRASHLHTIASHWLSEDCRARGWCEGADVNQDGIVNYLDFFLEPMDFIYIFAND